MKLEEILRTLAKAGKPQTAAIYKRHGAGDNVYGALTSDIARLQKKIKVNHTLAAELWVTGNAEARILALQVFDPQRLTPDDAERLLREGPAHFLGCYLASLIARSPIGKATMRLWMASSDESAREVGYGILSTALKDQPDMVSDVEARDMLKTIEEEIHVSPNWARHAMNGALISIGVFKESCRSEAMAAARRIGKVNVDPGETSCKTPDAALYVEKAVKHRRCP